MPCRGAVRSRLSATHPTPPHPTHSQGWPKYNVLDTPSCADASVDLRDGGSCYRGARARKQKLPNDAACVVMFMHMRARWLCYKPVCAHRFAVPAVCPLSGMRGTD